MAPLPPPTFTFQDALKQIESCGFECEAGPLTNNVAWTMLEDLAQDGPKFILGQWAWCEINATVAGLVLCQWMPFCIVGCTMTSSSARRTYVYSLSSDPPSACYGGKVHLNTVAEEKLFLTKPETSAVQMGGGL